MEAEAPGRSPYTARQTHAVPPSPKRAQLQGLPEKSLSPGQVQKLVQSGPRGYRSCLSPSGPHTLRSGTREPSCGFSLLITAR